MQQRRMGIASCEDQNHAAEFHVNNLPRHADTPLFQLQSKSSVSFRRKNNDSSPPLSSGMRVATFSPPHRCLSSLTG